MPASSIRVDGTRLSRADLAFLRVESVLNVASGLLIFSLVCLPAAHVLGRKLFNLPIPGFIDWVEQFMAFFVFAGLAYCQREGGHIRMEMFVGSLRGRRLWLAEFLSILLMLFLTTVLIYGGWYHFLRSFDFASPLWSRDSSIDISLPLWPAKLIVPVAMAVLWCRLVLQLWGFGRAFRLNSETPVAVPLVLDAAAQAEHEASTVRGADG